MIADKKNILYSGIGFLVAMAAVVYLGTSVIPKALVTLTKASTVRKVSIKNSLLIGQKMMAKADGHEKCIVNVFVLDSDGKGIVGRSVQLSGLGELDGATDSLGKATFELTSNTAQQYELTAQVGGVPLNGTVTVTFR
ncbi:MAG: Ig-like domain-containing protein [Candidatus Shapirobacteria bacterium]|nr:Ig-like domain-containing protein [Candidatus Shapirobacteria bacterium]MDD3002946.1 Ig-like domain-containing protein [Candidatus Shapirobacteria bacterium]